MGKGTKEGSCPATNTSGGMLVQGRKLRQSSPHTLLPAGKKILWHAHPTRTAHTVPCAGKPLPLPPSVLHPPPHLCCSSAMAVRLRYWPHALVRGMASSMSMAMSSVARLSESRADASCPRQATLLHRQACTFRYWPPPLPCPPPGGGHTQGYTMPAPPSPPSIEWV